MPRRSAGILVYRGSQQGLEVLLVHPGGPLWAKRDLGSWSVPKGEYADGENPEDAARREFTEETGWVAPVRVTLLGDVRQAGGKIVTAFAGAGDFDVETLESNNFQMEWPPRSGRKQSVAEVDRAAWFTLAEARRRILAGQAPLIDLLEQVLASPVRR